MTTGEYIQVLRLPTYVGTHLSRVGIYTLEDLCEYSRRELLGLYFIGPRAVRHIEAALALRGLTLRQD